MTPLDFRVLTGALGSGKTTLLAEFLRGPAAAETAVIVNEAGEIGLDGAILAEETGPFAMTTLANGCICCRLGSDLGDTIAALLGAERPPGAPPLRRIVLETSGLSRPGPILRQLASLGHLRMRIAVMATFDGERGAAADPEGLAQLAGADTVIVTKADRIGPDRLADRAAEARAANPLARIVADPDRAAAIGEAFAPPSGPVRPPVLDDESPPHPGLATTLLRSSRRVPFDDLAAFLDNLAGALGERLLRLKGLVRVLESERPLLVQSVGTVFSDPRPFGGEPGGASFLVVIARDADAFEIGAVGPDLGFVASRTATRPRAEAV